MMSAIPRNFDRHNQKSIGFRIPWAFAHRLDTVVAQKRMTRMSFIRHALEQVVQAAEDENQERPGE